MNIEFTKLHGLGNDFIFINRVMLQTNEVKDFITKIMNRRIGIGCDQLIIYQIIDDQTYSVKIYNPDGSEAGMCGNAMRCLGLYAFEKNEQKLIKVIVKNKTIIVEFKSANEIQVDMGIASFDKPWMQPLNAISQTLADYRLNLKEILLVDVGNPHIIIFYNNLNSEEKSLLGKTLQNHSAFPDGINVNFARVDHDAIYLKVFERGTGFTLACGSGACASFAAARKLKFIGESATIKFEIGDLSMYHSNEHIIMSGPAHKVATGYYYG